MTSCKCITSEETQTEGALIVLFWSGVPSLQYGTHIMRTHQLQGDRFQALCRRGANYPPNLCIRRSHHQVRTAIQCCRLIPPAAQPPKVPFYTVPTSEAKRGRLSSSWF